VTPALLAQRRAEAKAIHDRNMRQARAKNRRQKIVRNLNTFGINNPIFLGGLVAAVVIVLALRK
tara:strand:+ start:3346 stop:3537 length:192 start_codon:yes stop_codon:yes gene_type:complete